MCRAADRDKNRTRPDGQATGSPVGVRVPPGLLQVAGPCAPGRAFPVRQARSIPKCWRILQAACLAALCCLAAPKARADLDTIHSYTVTVEPRADGTADITYDFDWEVIGGQPDEPLSWVQIGLPNDRVDEFVNLTPETVSSVRYMARRGSSFAQVVFVKRYYAPDYAAAVGQEKAGKEPGNLQEAPAKRRPI